ncbi:hypothetical protein [Actinoalloteichus sp. AHMU CJ021]|uniref:hypothetical protein n=1 Tax=Actinoalloteichus sp. AHMU CJ021 TaxID=2072503 RepID=UPI00307BDEDF
MGAEGELCIGGQAVAVGYLGRPGLTAERFVPDPFGGPGDRLYRTGDRARFGPDGAVEYLGRRDGQVKLRGYRIELGEIEAALLESDLVRQAAVVLRGGEASRRLVAFVSGHPDAAEPPLGSLAGEREASPRPECRGGAAGRRRTGRGPVLRRPDALARRPGSGCVTPSATRRSRLADLRRQAHPLIPFDGALDRSRDWPFPSFDVASEPARPWSRCARHVLLLARLVGLPGGRRRRRLDVGRGLLHRARRRRRYLGPRLVGPRLVGRRGARRPGLGVHRPIRGLRGNISPTSHTGHSGLPFADGGGWLLILIGYSVRTGLGGGLPLGVAVVRRWCGAGTRRSRRACRALPARTR